MEPDERSAGILVSLSVDGGRDRLAGAKRFVRVRLSAAPGSLVSVILLDSGEYRIAEQTDPDHRPQVIARGKLPSARYVDERGWNLH